VFLNLKNFIFWSLLFHFVYHFDRLQFKKFIFFIRKLFKI